MRKRTRKTKTRKARVVTRKPRGRQARRVVTTTTTRTVRTINGRRRKRNPVDIEAPPEGVERSYAAWGVTDLGRPKVTTASWKAGKKRRSRRVRLDPELADVVRKGKIAREYIRSEAKARKPPKRKTRAQLAREEARAARELARVRRDVEAQDGGRSASLLTFVRRKGGIRVPAGHALRGEAKHAREHERLRPVVKLSGRRGRLPADMATLAHEAGYPITRGSETEILEALENETRGKPLRPRFMGQAMENPARKRRGLTRRRRRAYKKGDQPGATGRRSSMPRRNSKGRFVKGRSSSKRKSSRRRGRNPVPGLVDIYTINGRRRGKGKRRRSRRGRNPFGLRGLSGIAGGLFDLPTMHEFGLGLGQLAADVGANIVESKITTSNPTGTMQRIGQVLGGRAIGKLIAKGVGMIPFAPIRALAAPMSAAVGGGSMYRAIKTVLIPQLPAGKVKATLAEWGLRGAAPYIDRGYLVDGVNGQMWGLNGCDAPVPMGHVGSTGDGLAGDDEDDGLGDDDDGDDAYDG